MRIRVSPGLKRLTTMVPVSVWSTFTTSVCDSFLISPVSPLKVAAVLSMFAMTVSSVGSASGSPKAAPASVNALLTANIVRIQLMESAPQSRRRRADGAVYAHWRANAIYPNNSPSESRIGSTRVTDSLRFPIGTRRRSTWLPAGFQRFPPTTGNRRKIPSCLHRRPQSNASRVRDTRLVAEPIAGS